MKAWREALRAAREELGLSRAELARRAGMAASTIKSCELGTRHPSRAHLVALIEALHLSRAEANDVLSAAGYAIDATLFPGERYPAYFYAVDELPEVVERVPWPEFVTNDNFELVAANSAASALWGISFQRESAAASRSQRNLLSVASDRRFADRIINWDEVAQVLASVAKARPRGAETIDAPNPYFNEVLTEFARGDPAFLARLISAWNSAPPAEPKCRWSYRLTWRDPELGHMRFLAIVSTASEPDGLAFNDWHPLDADTWTVMERVKSRWAWAR
jgi:transcriptional regulator with XRE-family HTH domain